MFLADLAEFVNYEARVVNDEKPRKNKRVRVKKGVQENLPKPSQNSALISNLPLKGSYNYETTSGKGNLRGVKGKKNFSIVNNTILTDRTVTTNNRKGEPIQEWVRPDYVRTKETRNIRQRVTNRVERPTKLPNPTPVNSTPKPSGKKSSKFINKYSLGALGAAGVLGAGYVGYRAYQKRKKEDRK
jgi:hypothetical protein